MAFTITIKHWLLALILIYISVCGFKSGKADDYLPQTEAANGYLPYSGAAGGSGTSGTSGASGASGAQGQPQNGASGAQGQPQNGATGDHPDEIVTKALLCFNNHYIYSSCDEAYRLTENGNLNVPPEHVDQYCDSPCVTETHLVLNCIDNILTHFVFYNKATITDVSETIKAGCSHGPDRGDFNVAQHIQANSKSAHKASNPVLLLFGLVVMIMGCTNLLF